MIAAKPLFHLARPDAPRCAIFGNLFEEVVVRVEEERNARHETIDVQTGVNSPRDILDTVAERESEFLCRGRSCFANVITADGDRVVTRYALRAELECIDYQLHRRFDRIDPLFLRDVLLENVVL